MTIENISAEDFRNRVEANWQAYRKDLLSLSKEELIDKAWEIYAVRLTRDTLMDSGLDREAMEYLDRFKNPLEVVSDCWISEHRNDSDEGFDYVLWELRDKQDADQDYELMPGYAAPGREQTM